MQDALGPEGVDLFISAACSDMVLSAGLPWVMQGDFNVGPGALQVRLVLLDVRPDAVVQVLVRPGRLPDFYAAACRPREDAAAVQVHRRVGRTRWQ
eukprot:6012364-Pyramimonas_sp.AAC.1